jgi:hypothetical protein
MVERLDDALADDAFDSVEILDHATRRAARAQRPAQGDLETVRMAVHPRALPRMVRQRMRGLEAELLANERLEFSLRAHRLETPLEIREKAAGDVTIDNAMIER